MSSPLKTLLSSCAIWILVSGAAAGPAFGADAFDRQTSQKIQAAVAGKQTSGELSQSQANKLKPLAAGVEGTYVVVKTDDGNLAKALLTWGYRKGAEKPIPVLLINRYVTYDKERGDSTVAAGKDVMLFPGFQFNFDIGQVVPKDQGGDVEITDKGVLKTLGGTELFPLDGPQGTPAKAAEKNDPLDHEGVLPRDFSGTWKVHADGRWQGRWELTVDEDGNARGTYVSDETQSSYPVTGKVSGLPHLLKLNVTLANASQAFEAYLWTKDKSTMAGSFTLASRPFGFYAVRQ